MSFIQPLKNGNKVHSEYNPSFEILFSFIIGINRSAKIRWITIRCRQLEFVSNVHELNMWGNSFTPLWQVWHTIIWPLLQIAVVLLSQNENIMKMALQKNDLNVEEEEIEIQKLCIAKTAEVYETGCTHILKLPIRANVRLIELRLTVHDYINNYRETCWGAIYQSFVKANYRGMCSHTSSWLVGWLADFWVSNTNKRELKLSISLSNVKVRAAVPACINTTSIPFLTHLLKNASVWRYSIWLKKDKIFPI